MADCQLVLRYFALKNNENIRGSMKSMLDRAMEVKITEEQAVKLKQEYIDRLSFLYSLFGKKSFMLPPDEKGRERISAAIYDASMVAIDQLWNKRTEILADAVQVRARMTTTAADPEKLAVLTGQGNTAQAVKDRINLLRSIFFPE